MNKFLFLLLLSPGLSLAEDLKIEDPWIRAVPPSSKATAAFMTLVNKTDKPVLVTSGTCPIAGEIRPMVTTKQADGVMGMAFVESFSVPAHGSRVLEPGGDHIMLMKLKEVPKAGAIVPLVLATESGGEKGHVRLDLPVR
ncbi:MAG: copper chaperone PCu(A)C [Verrucomicrobiota bacterium]